MTGCYKDCFYYTDSCFRADCKQKGVDMNEAHELGWDINHGHYLPKARHYAAYLNGEPVLEEWQHINALEGYVDIKRTVKDYTDVHRIFGDVHLEPF